MGTSRNGMGRPRNTPLAPFRLFYFLEAAV
jgi:hypothetical protein